MPSPGRRRRAAIIFLSPLLRAAPSARALLSPAAAPRAATAAPPNPSAGNDGGGGDGEGGGGRRPRVAVVGGGLSGLVVSHVLRRSGLYDVVLFEREGRLGGNVRTLPDPDGGNDDGDGGTGPDGGERRRRRRRRLNVGHATHLGMFANLRLLLRHLGVEERPVGRGTNDVPGLFRTLSVACGGGGGGSAAAAADDDDGVIGRIVQPPLDAILSPAVWWDAFVFYYRSYLEPEARLDDFLLRRRRRRRRRRFGGDGGGDDAFLDVLRWSMATFEFDKTAEEQGEYALGAARALLVTQVFFKYLLCDAFGGRLPPRIDDGLREDLGGRVRAAARGGLCSGDEAERLVRVLDGKEGPGGAGGEKVPLASYFTADYDELVERLADVLDDVRLRSEVMRVGRGGGDGDSDGDGDRPRLVVETADGARTAADSAVLTMHPPGIAAILDGNDFPGHTSALGAVDMGAVGVKIVNASDLPFPYPPKRGVPTVPHSGEDPSPILGIFDISELGPSDGGGADGEDGAEEDSRARRPSRAGWLSVAYPVYRRERLNRHRSFLADVPHLDETVYPWTRATSSFPGVRRTLASLQGVGGVFVTGHAFTGVNKASELQVTNALNLCRRRFGAAPPWGNLSFPVAMLPDCNDDDAFRRAGSPSEAASLAWKNLVGSFLLVWAVSALGVESFE